MKRKKKLKKILRIRNKESTPEERGIDLPPEGAVGYTRFKDKRQKAQEVQRQKKKVTNPRSEDVVFKIELKDTSFEIYEKM